MLTDLQIKRLASREKRYEVVDAKGLYIRVEPTGSKTWIFRYVFNDSRKRLSLGSYPGISLAQARTKHGEAIKDLQCRIDPGMKAQEAKRRLKAEPTINEMIEEQWKFELSEKKSGPETLRLLKKDVLPAWGNRKARTIKRRDIVLLLDEIRERAPITANRVHGALSRFFNFCAERGVIEDSPCTRIRKPREHGRNRVLTDEEVRLFWQATNLENAAIDMYRVTKLALRLVLLTGQRPGEVAGMRWDEIEGDLWTISARRMKGKETHQVPLTSMTLDILEEARAYSLGDFVFGSSHKENEPIRRQAITRAVSRHWSEMGIKEPFTPHDLRRTLRTRLAGLGVMDVIAERILGHKLQGIMAVYNQYGYAKEKRQALERWEHDLCRILGIETRQQGKIIELRR